MPCSTPHCSVRLIGLLFAIIGPPVALAAPPPVFKVGECQDTHVEAIATPAPPDNQVKLTDGLTLHYYQENYRIFPLRVGQPVRVCLIDIGRFCGFREINTRTYLLHNPYTRRRQMLPDTAQICAKAR